MWKNDFQDEIIISAKKYHAKVVPKWILAVTYEIQLSILSKIISGYRYMCESNYQVYKNQLQDWASRQASGQIEIQNQTSSTVNSMPPSSISTSTPFFYSPNQDEKVWNLVHHQSCSDGSLVKRDFLDVSNSFVKLHYKIFLIEKAKLNNL